MFENGVYSFHRLITPSTAAGGPPPSMREVWWLRRSRPPALPSIGYRGFAVAPMTLRAPSRNLVYNSGCRVATLLVSKGVMGFLGDLRGRNSKSPPNPLGLRSASHRPQTMIPPFSKQQRCNQQLQMHLTVAMMQPSVANASHSCNFPQRCRGAHRAPADILPTSDSPPQRPPSPREGDRPQTVEGVRRRWKEFADGGKSSYPMR